MPESATLKSCLRATVLTTYVLKPSMLGWSMAHMTSGHRSMKSWRAILRPDRSWISRGLLSIVFYAGFGFGYLALTWLGLGEAMGLSAGIVGLVKALAVLSALVGSL